jgi:conjugal transfer ATP-binding protein TraC
MMTDRGSGVGRLTVDKYSLLLYSTAPEDVQAINTYVKQNFSTAEAIKAVINDRGARV